jgi:hypothetical protein
MNFHLMKTVDHAHADALPLDLGVCHPQWSRRASHALAYGFFCVGVTLAWCKSGEPFALADAVLLLAIAWFPALITELFRRLSIPNPAVAAALLSGIAGYDGILRLLRPWVSNGC